MSAEHQEQKEAESYFKEKTRHAIVETFVFLCTNRAIVVKSEIRVRIPERDYLAREITEYSVLPEVETNHARAYRENHVSYLQRKLAETPVYNTVDEYVPDERCKDLKQLIQKYRTEITTQERRQLEVELYPLVMLVLDENLIEGKFELPPLQDFLKFKELERRIAAVEDRQDKMDATSVDLPHREDSD